MIFLIVGGLLLGVAGYNAYSAAIDFAKDKVIEYRLIKASLTQTALPDVPAPTTTALYEKVDPANLHNGSANPSDSLPTQTPLPVRSGYIPDRIEIPVLAVDAPVVSSDTKTIQIDEHWFKQFNAPDFLAVGWYSDSAPLGITGNTVLGGHHNVDGKVFKNLAYLQVDDEIILHSGAHEFKYRVMVIKLLNERDAALDVRLANAKWIEPTGDERITLITCWPKNNNTHRLIVVAYPESS